MTEQNNNDSNSTPTTPPEELRMPTADVSVLIQLTKRDSIIQAAIYSYDRRNNNLPGTLADYIVALTSLLGCVKSQPALKEMPADVAYQLKKDLTDLLEIINADDKPKKLIIN